MVNGREIIVIEDTGHGEASSSVDTCRTVAKEGKKRPASDDFPALSSLPKAKCSRTLEDDDVQPARPASCGQNAAANSDGISEPIVERSRPAPIVTPGQYRRTNRTYPNPFSRILALRRSSPKPFDNTIPIIPSGAGSQAPRLEADSRPTTASSTVQATVQTNPESTEIASHTSSKSTSVLAAMKPKKSARASSPSRRPLHSATKYHRRVPAAPAAPPPATADTPAQPSEESTEINQLKAIAARHRAEAARHEAEADRHKAEAVHHGDIAASTERLIADMRRTSAS